ncbi:Ppx/GppA phosphatase family protein [Cytophaga aurantiaca]|uniref:Ppx/GppA phosphatase family protein n=1 Tax=Cytophaga aurantiaca TaxID=29530 RepID=UPI00036E77A3|nr:phosphatase [Cytophaga aurantiaca]
MKLAAVDIGSNAIRFQVSKILEYNGMIMFKKMEYVRFPLRLGEDVFRLGMISAEKEMKFIKLIQTFKNLFELYEVDDYMITATSAMRESKNGKDIVLKVKGLVGVDIDIIDGDKEAELINTVLHNELDDSSYIHIDVGGGSTELNLFVNRKKIAARSFKIGSVRRLQGLDAPEEWAEMKQWVKDNIDKLPKPVTAIGTGGNIGKIFELGSTERNKKDKRIISLKKIEEVQHNVSQYSYEDRINVLMLNSDRADVIIPASEIYTSVMEFAKAKHMLVPEVGLKDGLMLMLYERNKHLHITDLDSIRNVNKYQK